MKIVNVTSAVQEFTDGTLSDPHMVIIFEDNGVEKNKRVLVSSCARAVSKELRNEWYYQVLRTAKEAYRDFQLERGETISKMVPVPEGLHLVDKEIDRLNGSH